MDTTIDDDLVKKPARYTLDCAEMLDEAITYLRERSPKAAEKMGSRFFKIIDLLEIMPELGTKHKKGMRKFLLGKFNYNIYYRELETEIEILGIWHTSKGTDFADIYNPQ